MNFRLTLLMTALLWISGNAHSQAPVPGSPEAVVNAYMDALQKDGMAAAADFIHPDELSRFKEMLMPLFRRESGAQERPLTAALIGSDATLEKIEAMSGAQMMRNIMRIVGEQMPNIRFESIEILGSVREGEVVHVVSRIHVGAEPITLRQLEVISVKPYEKGWKLMLTGEIEGLAAALNAR